MGVPHNVTESQLITQWKRLCLQYHPDKNMDPRAEEAFKGGIALSTSLIQRCIPHSKGKAQKRPSLLQLYDYEVYIIMQYKLCPITAMLI